MVRYYISSYINWADEIDIPYGHVYSLKDYKEANKYINTLIDKLGEDKKVCVYIGTNEEIEVSLDQVLEWLAEAKTITESEYKVLDKFGLTDFGPDLYDAACDGTDEEIKELEEQEKIKIIERKRKLTPEEKQEKKRAQKLNEFRSFIKQ